MKTDMQWLNKLRDMKVILVLMALVMGSLSLVVSHFLVNDLKTEEYHKMEVWAEAMQSINNADENTDISIELRIVEGNNTIPVIVLDSEEHVSDVRNVPDAPTDEKRRQVIMGNKAKSWKDAGHSMRIDLPDGDYQEVCFSDSLMLRRLALWPYVQLGIVLVFVAVAIFALLSNKSAEQNKLWVGLSKETAHQLGTPISSLMAWNEVLRESYPNDELLSEMGKDVERLNTIAERFSKIGSTPEPKPENLNEIIEHAVAYIGRRTSNHVKISSELPNQPIITSLTAPLFEWVLENLCKNAIDAIEGEGRIVVSAKLQDDQILIDVTDTGKGIAKNQFKKVFTPGFTTKTRGWGLGLSLAKRIIEEYHHGRIFVKNSEIGKGTTFRIELKNKPTATAS